MTISTITAWTTEGKICGCVRIGKTTRTSGLIGEVRLNTRALAGISDGVFEVKIRYKRKLKYIGRFKNEIKAAKAYDKKARELFGEFAYLNFPAEGR